MDEKNIQQEEVKKEKPAEEKEEKKKEKKLTAEQKLQQRIDQLEEENQKLAMETAASKNAYYKAYADADNLKKRLQAQADEANKYRIQTFALSILPSLDSLELALAGKDENDPFVKGVRLTYNQIVNALKNEGVEKVDCLNKPFDANNCHAIMTEKVEGTEPNIVIEVLQPGYMIKDRLLRAALVKVSE